MIERIIIVILLVVCFAINVIWAAECKRLNGRWRNFCEEMDNDWAKRCEEIIKKHKEEKMYEDLAEQALKERESNE